MSMTITIYNKENINKLKENLNTNENNNKLDSQIHNLRLQTKIYINKSKFKSKRCKKNI